MPRSGRHNRKTIPPKLTSKSRKPKEKVEVPLSPPLPSPFPVPRLVPESCSLPLDRWEISEPERHIQCYSSESTFQEKVGHDLAACHQLAEDDVYADPREWVTVALAGQACPQDRAVGGPLALLDSETSERRSVERTRSVTWRQKTAPASSTSPRRTGEFPGVNAEYRRPCENRVDGNLPGGRVLPAILYCRLGRRWRGLRVGIRTDPLQIDGCSQSRLFPARTNR